jgi:hypothetical protein
MMPTNPNLIYRQAFNAQKLVADFPPKFQHPYKELVYQQACPSGCTHNGDITFSRWKTFALPQVLPSTKANTIFEVREDLFGYEPSINDSTTEWYLNFAHHHLFVAYASALFAQDEMQVAEHPALGALREALLKLQIKPLTVEEEQPTPILIKGVERRCQIATNPNPTQLRPYGLYGNNFARADRKAIELATTPLNPSTLTNLIAMEAPAGGRGAYTEEQITYILNTVFTGFSAAKLESQSIENKQISTVIHTGFWGCGANGGNRTLMALLQLLAAHMAAIERLVFHTADANGARTVEAAREILESKLLALPATQIVIEQIAKMDFQWGASDGN